MSGAQVLVVRPPGRRTAVLVTTGAAVLLTLVGLVTGVQPGRAASGTWTTAAPSGFPRQEVSYVEAGGRMYLLGWKSNVHKVYDPVGDTWSTAAPLPAPELLDHVQAAALDGKVYYIGGLRSGPGDSVGAVYVYDTATNRFSVGAPLPAGRDRGAGGVAVAGGRIYLAGGVHDGATVPWVDVYDPATFTWTALPDMPHRRNHFQAAVVGDRLWAIGGRSSWSSTAFVAHNDAFDLTSGTWSSGYAPLPTLRSGFGAAVFGSEIVIMGGEGGRAMFGEVEAYDTATDTWRALAPMPTPRHGIQTAMWNGAAYVANGATAAGGGSGTDVQEVLTVGGTPGPRPDAHIRTAAQTAFVGDDVHNSTGAGQTRRTTAPPGQRRTFVVRVQNDGGAADGLQVRGCPAAPGFRIRYLAGTTGTTDITPAVMGGTYTVDGVAPGGTAALRLEVTPAATTKAGAVQSCLVAVTSTSAPTVEDAVRARVTVS